MIKRIDITTSYTTVESMVSYIKANPGWLAGFISGEGSFTGSLGLNTSAAWGINIGMEFCIIQNSGDLLVLEAIKAYFGCGGIYSRPNGTNTYSVRNLDDLILKIIPFFLTNHMLGTKTLEFRKWAEICKIFHSKLHVGRDLEQRDVFLQLVECFTSLNSKVVFPEKQLRLRIIKEYLINLKSAPSKVAREDLKELITQELLTLKASRKGVVKDFSKSL